MDVAVRAVLSGWSEAQREIDDTAKSLDRLKDTSTTGARAANDDIQKLTGSLGTFARVGGVAVGVAVAVTAAALIGAAANVKKYGQELHLLSQQTGKSVEELSSLRVIAESNGLTIRQAAEGWVTGSAAMAKLQDEARKAGIVMSEETARAAHELNENMAVLKSYGEGFLQEVAAPIVEGLAKITRSMRDAKREGAGFWATLIAGFRTTFSGDDEHMLNEEITAQTSALLTAQNNLDRLRQRGAMPSVIARQEQMVAAIRGELDRMLAIKPVMATTLDELHVEKPETEAQRRARERREATEAERKRKEELREAQEQAEALVKVEELSAKDTKDAWDFYYQWEERKRKEAEKHARVTAEAEVAVEEMAAKDAREAWEAFFALEERKRAEMAAIFGPAGVSGTSVLAGTHQGLTGEISEVLRGNQGLGTLAKHAGQILVDEMVREVSRTISRELLKPFKGLFEEMGNVFSGVLKDIFGDVFGSLSSGLSSLGPSLSNIGGGLSSLLGSLGFAGAGVGVVGGVIDWIRNPAENIASFFATGFSGFGSFLGDLFPTGTSGSVYTSPSLIMVGDAGPEMVSVSPLGGAAHGGRGGGVTINVNGLSMMDAYQAKRLARVINGMR